MQLDGSSFAQQQHQHQHHGLLGLPLLHSEQPPLLPRQQQIESLDTNLIADLVASIAGYPSVAGGGEEGESSPLRAAGEGGGSSSDKGLSELVRSLIAGRDSAVQQQETAERRMQDGVTLVRAAVHYDSPSLAHLRCLYPLPVCPVFLDRFFKCINPKNN